ncbi:carboxypeptidase-like regulatory domain-containing protein [Lacihabitans sp. CCS-44]|uniref:carboxypeptidase-like regulatory domain-containing protein n=1 Tax=Lacihabitans sp. CCS-44 TaxID=2487331 RepID=UPI0020CC45CA|nr:carboxypeptidase-like regulatory domain-containing protein [Lacihabitans sp. CCS-44]MCP9754739.1 carboxypeptidase-like regulatory domain-containing protein [Lacihabitans sp. CCS-44]
MRNFGFLFIFYAVFFIDTMAISQNKISGIVIDETTKRPIIGVKILENESNIQTFTNEEGEFEITLNTPFKALTITHVEYERMIKTSTKDLQIIPLVLLAKKYGLELQNENSLAILTSIKKNKQNELPKDYFLAGYYKQVAETSNLKSLEECTFTLNWNNKWGALGWIPKHIRFVNRNKEKALEGSGFITNLTLYLNALDILSLPQRDNNLRDIYNIETSHFLNYGKEDEIIVLKCEENRSSQLKQTMLFNGEFYISTKNNQVKRIVGEYKNAKTKDYFEVFLDCHFETNRDSNNTLSYQFLTETKEGIKKYKSVNYLYLQEENNKTLNVNDIQKLKYNVLSKPPLMPYNQSYWKSINIIKRAKSEIDFIKNCEENGSFISKGKL